MRRHNYYCGDADDAADGIIYYDRAVARPSRSEQADKAICDAWFMARLLLFLTALSWFVASLSGCLLAGSMGPSITASTGDEPLVSASLFPERKGGAAAGVEAGDDDTAIIRIPDSMTGLVILAKGTLPAESVTTTASRPGILDWLKGSEQAPPPPGGER